MKAAAKEQVAGAGNDGRGKYAQSEHKPPALVPFECAVQIMAPWSNSPRHDLPSFPGRLAILHELFGGRVGIEAIQGWRKGRREPPEWAKEIAATKMDEISESAAAVSKMLRSTPQSKSTNRETRSE